MTATRLTTALVLIASLVIAGNASAQSATEQIPAGYEPAPVTVSPARVSPAPDAGLDVVIAASLSGDRRLALRTLSELERGRSPSPRLRMVRASIEMRLDPRNVLTLSSLELVSLSDELDAIRDQRLLGIGLGVAAAITGAASLATMLGGFLGSVNCGVALVIPWCASGTPDPGIMAASSVLGVSSVVLTGVSIGMLADAGSRQGRVASALRVSGGASADGASFALSGSF